MAIPPVPTRHQDEAAHRQRMAESINSIRDFTFDDSRVRTPAEIDAEVPPVNYAYAPGDVRRYGAKGDGVTDDTAAIAAAFTAADGGGEVNFAPDGVYLVTALMSMTGPSHLRIHGNGATIRARLTQTENVWTFLDADDIQIDDLTFDGGYSVTTYSNQIISFRDPKNCTVRNCRFSDWERTAVLMFSADRNSSGAATNNHIIDCWCDGLAAAAAGFIEESMDASTQINCWAFNIRDNPSGPNYGLEFKDHCTRCSMLGGGAVNCKFGVVMADDGSVGTVGSGANDCVVRGTVAIACLTGFTGNYMAHCSVEMEIDQQNISDGVCGVEIGAHGNLCNWNVAIKRHTNASVAVVDTRSDDMSVIIREWDRTGTVLWLIETGVERNRLILQHIDTNSATFAPSSLVTDSSGATGGNANYLQDLRNFPYSEVGSSSAAMYFDVPGQLRSTHALRMASDQFVVRTGGTDRVQFNNANSGWYPQADNAYDNGITAQRWRSMYTNKIFLGATSSTQFLSAGAGSPESVVTAPVGSLYLRTDGGATTTLYVKTSGTGNTGWTAK